MLGFLKNILLMESSEIELFVKKKLIGMIKINIGGILFYSSRETLEKYDCFFNHILQHENVDALFVDRDPTYFRHVLNYMRGSTYLPNDICELQQLKEEADFYCLLGLIININNKLETYKFFRNHPINISLETILQKLS